MPVTTTGYAPRTIAIAPTGSSPIVSACRSTVIPPPNQRSDAKYRDHGSWLRLSSRPEGTWNLGGYPGTGG